MSGRGPREGSVRKRAYAIKEHSLPSRAARASSRTPACARFRIEHPSLLSCFQRGEACPAVTRPQHLSACLSRPALLIVSPHPLPPQSRSRSLTPEPRWLLSPLTLAHQRTAAIAVRRISAPHEPPAPPHPILTSTAPTHFAQVHNPHLSLTLARAVSLAGSLAGSLAPCSRARSLWRRLSR